MKKNITQKEAMEFHHRVIIEQKFSNNGFITSGFAWNEDEDSNSELKKHLEAIMTSDNVHMFFIKYNS